MVFSGGSQVLENAFWLGLFHLKNKGGIGIGKKRGTSTNWSSCTPTCTSSLISILIYTWACETTCWILFTTRRHFAAPEAMFDWQERCIRHVNHLFRTPADAPALETKRASKWAAPSVNLSIKKRRSKVSPWIVQLFHSLSYLLNGKKRWAQVVVSTWHSVRTDTINCLTRTYIATLLIIYHKLDLKKTNEAIRVLETKSYCPVMSLFDWKLFTEVGGLVIYEHVSLAALFATQLRMLLTSLIMSACSL